MIKNNKNEPLQAETDEFFMLFKGRVEVPNEPNFIEKAALSLKVDLSPTELTTVKWLAFQQIYMPHSVDFGNGWRTIEYCELDREKITDLIMHVKTAHTEKDPVPKWYRDYHEFGVHKVKSPYDFYSSSDEEDDTQIQKNVASP